jgi:hypothetical protein
MGAKYLYKDAGGNLVATQQSTATGDGGFTSTITCSADGTSYPDQTDPTAGAPGWPDLQTCKLGHCSCP